MSEFDECETCGRSDTVEIGRCSRHMRSKESLTMSSQDDPRQNRATWSDSWLTADDARSQRADDRQPRQQREQARAHTLERETQARILIATMQARNKQTRRQRKTRALTFAALLLAMALGILGLLTSSPIPGIG